MPNLYDEDIVFWSREQAQALRAASGSGTNLPIDWENVAEEIESVGASQRAALSSNLRIIIEHLLKLQTSSATDPRRGCGDSIRRARAAIEDLLESSPSLRLEVAPLIAKNLGRSRQMVRSALEDHGEQPLTALDAISYGEEQVIGDWFP